MTYRGINYTHRVRAKPAWAIIGIERDRGDVMLLASDELSSAYMEAEVAASHGREFFDPKVRMMPDTVYTLETRMGNIYVAIGDTWLDAFAKLFGEWEPRTREQRQLPTQPRELPAQSQDS